MIDLPEIFCPQCDTLILLAGTCPTCGWRRPEATAGLGELVWQRELEGKLAPPYVSPAAAGDLIFFPIEDGQPTTTIIALDGRSGRTVWTFTLPEGRVVRHLVAADDLLLVAPEDMRVLGDARSTLTALEASSGEVRWERELPSHSLATPLRYDHEQEEYLFLTGSSEEAYLLDPADGRLRATIAGLPPWIALPPLLSGGGIFLPGRTASLNRLDLTTRQTTPFFQAPDGDHWFNFALAEARDPHSETRLILAPNWNSILYALDEKTGRPRWQVRLERGPSSPAAGGRHVYIGAKITRDGDRGYALQAYDIVTGDLLWSYPTTRHIHAPPLPVGDLLFAGSKDGHFFALEANDGSLVWDLELADKPFSVPLIHENLVMIATAGGSLMAVSWRQAPLLDGELPAAAELRQQEDWEAAAAVAALGGEFLAAAADIARTDRPLRAAQLYEKGGDWPAAAAAFLAANRPEQALKLYEQHDDARQAAALLSDLERYEEAARYYERLDETEAAALAYEKAGMLAQAAQLFARNRQPMRAAGLYLTLDQPEMAAQQLADGGRLAEAAELLRGADRPEQAARLLEQAGELGEAALMWRNLGQEEEALRLYRLNQDLEPALEIALARSDWASVRTLAFDLNRFELEADACLKMAEAATGNARYDHYVAAGQALVRAARILEEERPEATREQREEIAALWDEAAEAFASGLEGEETIRRCLREARRVRRWPELTFEVSAARELVADEFHSLLIKVSNVGFGVARAIHFHVLGDYFDGDIDQTQHLSGLRPGATETLLLRVKPKQQAIGSAVPLDLELSYLLPNDHDFSRRVRGQVPVKRRDTGYLTPSPTDPAATPKPAIDIYQDHSTPAALEPPPSAPPGLRQLMVTYLTDSEVRDVCFDLEIDYEILAGEHKGDKIRELIIYCEKRKMTERLLQKCAALYTQVDWWGATGDGA